MGYGQYDNNDVRLVDDDGHYAKITTDGKVEVNGEFSAESVDTTGDQLSSWMPNPDIQIIGKAKTQYDISNNQVSRAQVLTDERSFRDDFTGTRFGVALTGTMHFENGSYTVIGNGTKFTTEVKEDQFIRYADDLLYNSYTRVSAIVSDTELTLTEGYRGSTQSGDVNGRISNWGCIQTGNATRAVSNSVVQLSLTTLLSDSFYIRNVGDYGPIIGSAFFKISQRIANQEAKLGFFNDITSEDFAAYFLFDGTSNTTVKCISRSSSNSYDVETTTCTLPADVLTSNYHSYRIEVEHNRVSFTIDNSINVVHQVHCPGPYDSMGWNCGIQNTGTAESATSIYVDYVDIANMNTIQSSNFFKNDPISVYQAEEVHTLYGKLVSTTNTVDQVVVSYVVPTNRVACIVNYSLEQDTSVTTIGKVGKNTVTTEPAAPGALDGSILRVFRINSANPPASSVRETFNIPLRFAHGGDTIKLTVSPSAGTSTNYRGSIDFILR
jgi:hypothetical protein